MSGTIKSSDTYTLIAAALCRRMRPSPQARDESSVRYSPRAPPRAGRVLLTSDAVGTTPEKIDWPSQERGEARELTDDEHRDERAR